MLHTNCLISLRCSSEAVAPLLVWDAVCKILVTSSAAWLLLVDCFDGRKKLSNPARACNDWGPERRGFCCRKVTGPLVKGRQESTACLWIRQVIPVNPALVADAHFALVLQQAELNNIRTITYSSMCTDRACIFDCQLTVSHLAVLKRLSI